MQASLSSSQFPKSALVASLALTVALLSPTAEAAITATAPAATKAPAAKQTAAPRTGASKAGRDKVSPAKAKKNAAEAAVIEKFVALQDAAIATFLELGDTLRSVKDRESADAASPTVKMAGEQLFTIITAVEALGEPSEAAQQAIMARVANIAEKNEIVEQVMVPLLTLMMQEPPCYGSETLQTELTNLLANLQGAAGIEDEEVEEATESAPLQEPDADETTEPAGSAE